MNKLVSVEKEIKQEIMSTDVYIKLVSHSHPIEKLEADTESCLAIFRGFENRFSRFIKGNELSIFNESEGELTVSNELMEMLIMAKKYYDDTEGLFDPGILPYLQKEGYVNKANKGFVGNNEDATNVETVSSIREVIVKEGKVLKPKQVKVDLGGIGKGYVVDLVAKKLSLDYQNFIVDAGGDMYCAGSDIERGYKYWAIGVENPFFSGNDLVTLALGNRSVATSGVNRRKWLKDGEDKSHLIDPRTNKSTASEVVSCTVVGDSTVYSDVMAKTLLLMGLAEGKAFAEVNKIPALFVDHAEKVYINSMMEENVWKE